MFKFTLLGLSLSIFTSFLLNFSSNQLMAAGLSSSFCTTYKDLAKFPIQQNGRVKPLYVHAKNVIKHLTHKTQIGKYDAVSAYCILSFQGFNMGAQEIDLKARIDHIKLQEFLNLSSDHRTISFSKLVDLAKDIRVEMRKTPEGSYQKALVKWVRNISLYQELTSGKNWLIPEINNQLITWLPLTSIITPQKIQANITKNPDVSPVKSLFDNIAKEYIQLKGDKHVLEYKYAKLHLPGIALIISLLALLVATLSNKAAVYLTPVFLTILIQTVYIILRVMISGRAPITNMYETVMFSGYGALLFSMAIGHFKKSKIFLIVGIIYNAITLMMMMFASGMLNEEINPLVPVLRDNFWLSTHVTCLLLSYGALALSWILGNIIIIKRSFFHIDKKEEATLNDLIYTILKFGTTLLATGIILGGVWADYSWGRFWGWDPKETWSLIVLCIYIAILHGRYTTWISPRRFAPITAGAFMSVMMAWFGVNYILATGLHSYGFSQGGAIFLATFFLTQILVLLFTHFKSKSLNSRLSK